MAVTITVKLTKVGANWSDAQTAFDEAWDADNGAYDSVGLSAYDLIKSDISSGKCTREISLPNSYILQMDHTWSDDNDFKKVLIAKNDLYDGEQAFKLNKRTPKGGWSSDISASKVLSSDFADITNLPTES